MPAIDVEEHMINFDKLMQALDKTARIEERLEAHERHCKEKRDENKDTVDYIFLTLREIKSDIAKKFMWLISGVLSLGGTIMLYLIIELLKLKVGGN